MFRVTEYNIRNGPIRLQILTATKVIGEQFLLAWWFSRYPHFKVSDLKNVDQGLEI